MMIQYEDLLNRLRTSVSDDVSAGEPVSADEIAEAEHRLQVSFPRSYRRFLEVLGALDVPPVEVFGAGAAGVFPVVEESVRWRDEGVVPATAVVIEIDGVEGDPVGFVPSADGAEPAIVRWEAVALRRSPRISVTTCRIWWAICCRKKGMLPPDESSIRPGASAAPAARWRRIARR
ncbi:MAG TPA: SMI1/KNR4 family protein [Longimicrobium sp.]|jgi:hypothetical protein